MIEVVACSNPSGNAALEGVVSGCGGVDTGELVLEIVANVWPLTETSVQGGAYASGGPGRHVHANPPSDTPPPLFAVTKHGSKVLASWP